MVAYLFEQRVVGGILVGVVFACCGLWLLWRGLRNDIWRDLFGGAVIPRWMYMAGGSLLTGIAVAYVRFLRQFLTDW